MKFLPKVVKSKLRLVRFLTEEQVKCCQKVTSCGKIYRKENDFFPKATHVKCKTWREHGNFHVPRKKFTSHANFWQGAWEFPCTMQRNNCLGKVHGNFLPCTLQRNIWQGTWKFPCTLRWNIRQGSWKFPLPDFIRRGPGYKSVYYGINNTRPIYSERAHRSLQNP